MRLLVEVFTLLALARDVEPPRRLRGPRLDRPAGVHRARRLRPLRRGRRPGLHRRSWRSSLAAVDRRAGGARRRPCSPSGCAAATSPSGRGSSPRSSGSSIVNTKELGGGHRRHDPVAGRDRPRPTRQALTLLAGPGRRASARSSLACADHALAPRPRPAQRSATARWPRGASASTSSGRSWSIYLVAAVGCGGGRSRHLHAVAADPAELRRSAWTGPRRSSSSSSSAGSADRGPDRRHRSCSSCCRRRSRTMAACIS